MSAIAIDISEFTGKMKELIFRLKRDEEIVITENNQPIARLLPVATNGSQQNTQPRPIGLIEGPAWMSPDFDEPLEDFAEYMP
jgi:prevent-host-death family protein